MDLPIELERLANLHAAGALSDEAFTAAKAALVAGQSQPGAGGIAGVNDDASVAADEIRALRAQVATLERERAVAQLDRAWDAERESYMVTLRGQHSYRRYLPTRAGTVWYGVFVVTFIIVMTAMARWPIDEQELWLRRINSHSGHFRGEISPFDRWFYVLFGPDGWTAIAILGLMLITVWCVNAYRKAVAHEAAEITYRAKRAQLVSGEPYPMRSASDPTPDDG